MSLIQLTEGETSLKTIHRHMFYFFNDILSIIVFVALPIIFAISLVLLPKEYTDVMFAGDTNSGILFIATTWLLFAWMFAWYRWTDFFLDVMVITDKRVFEIKQNGFFNREVSSFGLDRIENIKVTQVGVLASLLNYGDILIETAGDGEDLMFTYIPDPNELKKFISELQDHDKIIHV